MIFVFLGDTAQVYLVRPHIRLRRFPVSRLRFKAEFKSSSIRKMPFIMTSRMVARLCCGQKSQVPEQLVSLASIRFCTLETAFRIGFIRPEIPTVLFGIMES